MCRQAKLNWRTYSSMMYSLVWLFELVSSSSGNCKQYQDPVDVCEASFFLDNGLKIRFHLPNMVESDQIYNVQHPALTKESCRNKVTTLKISNNRNKVYNYAAPTLLRESQPLEWKKGNTEDSRWPAACTSSPRQSSWRWNFAHWRSQWVPRKSTYKKKFLVCICQKRIHF